ncbi:tetratricopeptide repeat protein [Clostridium rectalis]|uniref:tetratricopeptide repeat protein n=1 Tax=Clostridium rectalis TaxID=2040295 RepID=UPI001FA9DE9D|nr:hypothetical protein [Clostridium rectalis]
MFKKLPVKTKVIIFICLSVIGIYSILRNEINNKNKYNLPNTSMKSVEEDKKDNIEDKKIKKLDDIYSKAYKAFFDNKYNEAIKYAQESIKIDNNFYKGYNIKGIAMCFNGDFDEGMKNIDKSLSIKPDYGYARFNKALAYELYEKFDEALKWYDKNLEIENYIWSYYGKASIYGRRGDAVNAVKYLKTAINMDKTVKEEAKKEKDFDPIRQNKAFQELIKN